MSKIDDGDQMEIDELAEMFGYLDDLRESGETNMWGAAPYLERNFALERKNARDVLGAWMETFSRTESPNSRAQTAIARATQQDEE